MLFEVGDLGALAHVEGVDAVVLGVAAAAVVDAAAGHDLHLSALADEEVVVHEILDAGLGDHHGDVHRLALGAGIHVDVDAGLVGLGDDVHVLGVPVEGALAVGAEVHRARLGQRGHVRHLAENFGLDFIQHSFFPSSL